MGGIRPPGVGRQHLEVTGVQTAGDLAIRPARTDEAALLSDLGAAAKASWGYDEAFMTMYRAEFDLTPDFIKDNIVYAAELNGAVVGFFALEPQPGGAEYQLLDLFVRPERFGQGIGRALLNRALAEARRSGADLLYLLSDPNAETFYLRMGAIRQGRQRSRSGARVLARLAFELRPAAAAD